MDNPSVRATRGERAEWEDSKIRSHVTAAAESGRPRTVSNNLEQISKSNAWLNTIEI